ncbi:DUF6054 family protein [Sinanaerobacter chloroacetimidivorans]|jgi:hypothetical protein|uniref:Uncharacterized protein n=1 Tax=Sinanaerobacter chloroacetimidivorans TaxID=2818044 RepID=A0A8J8B148_9FIRM|nr:DUF6054 family protein [Sinanaerobacter chloroacetimidivorans]MBR0598328.1 hypothetical protein [Sinanaerobacter chloroacetimidivorans]
MAMFQRIISGDFDDVVNRLHDIIMKSAMSIQLIDQCQYDVQDVKTIVMVYDKYYMRSSNRASLTVSVIGHGSTVMVCAIGAGGSTGTLFNFSWGAEEDFVSVVERAINQIS